jgi:hypothetical protein
VASHHPQVLAHESRNLSQVCALDILTPLTLTLNGDAVVFATTTAVDFSPEVGHRVACHWCAMLHRRVVIWLH